MVIFFCSVLSQSTEWPLRLEPAAATVGGRFNNRGKWQKHIPARDPKHCVVRILKGKAERTYSHQWLQASRTRATLVVKRTDARSDSASSLCEDLCRRSRQELLERFSVETAVQGPCVRLSVQGVYRRSPQKIFARDLKVSSLFKLSMHDLRARPLLSSPGLCTRSR